MVATKHFTVEEFESMPLEGHWELIDGELVEVSPAAEGSSHTSATIVVLVGQHVREHRLGRVYAAESGFVLFPDRATVRAPDAAFVRADRVPHGEARKHFSRLAPDLAVEVLSPTDRMADALAKIAMYLQAGVQLVWLVDPDRRSVTLFRSDESIQIFTAEDVPDFGEVIPGLSIRVADIFA